MPSRYLGSSRTSWDLGTLFFFSIHLSVGLHQWKQQLSWGGVGHISDRKCKKKPSLALIHPQSKISSNSTFV